MKILRVAPDIYPYTVGGIGIHVHEMSKEQVRMGHDVTVYTASEGAECAYEAPDGYHVRNFKQFAKIFGNSIIPNMFVDLVKDQAKY